MGVSQFVAFLVIGEKEVPVPPMILSSAKGIRLCCPSICGAAFS